MNPLVRKLELMEKAKVKEKLQEEGKWKDYRKGRSQKTNATVKTPHVPHPETPQRKDPREAAMAIDRKIAEIRSKAGYISKDSEEADEIRILEEERSSVISGTSRPTSIAALLLERMAAIRS